MNLVCSFSNKVIKHGEDCVIYFIQPKEITHKGTSFDPYDYFENIFSDQNIFIEGKYKGFGDFDIDEKIVNAIKVVKKIESIIPINNKPPVSEKFKSKNGKIILSIDDNNDNENLNIKSVLEKSYQGMLENISIFVVKKDIYLKFALKYKDRFSKKLTSILNDNTKSEISKIQSIELMFPESIRLILLETNEINIDHFSDILSIHKSMLDKYIRILPSFSKI